MATATEAGVATDVFLAGVTAAWAAGPAGWDRLAAEWGATPEPSAPLVSARCWWDEPPWCGQIASDEFRAIVSAYVARYGAYTPDLPLREPEILETWRRALAPTRGAAA
jgi:hypothetical protein